MYNPASFRVDDPAQQVEFIRRHSFATLVTHDGVAPFASHIPMLIEETGDQRTLVAHMARANPQWRQFDECEVLAIFSGPHAYVSPSWYETELAVPTWNYAAVHAYGVPRLIDDRARVWSILRTMVDKYESAFETPWSGDIPAGFRDAMIDAIVAFDIPIRRIEAKFKLSQNRPVEDQRRVREQLRHGGAESRAVAELMDVACDL